MGLWMGMWMGEWGWGQVSAFGAALAALLALFGWLPNRRQLWCSPLPPAAEGRLSYADAINILGTRGWRLHGKLNDAIDWLVTQVGAAQLFVCCVGGWWLVAQPMKAMQGCSGVAACHADGSNTGGGVL